MTPLPRFERTLVALGVERALYQWRNGSHTLKGIPVPHVRLPLRVRK